ncbi:MAG: response regulator transcription factor [Bacillota bacterium]|nr:response regulator transcription factor [Bacillota bacterium]
MAGDRILVVDDEPKIREIVRVYLQRDGFAVEEAEDGEQALAKVKALNPQLVILDLMLPGVDGWEVCRQIRRTSAVPIIMLTARGEETDRVVGLEMGADDYVPKPFSPRELVARVKAVLRRTRPRAERGQVLQYGDLLIDRDCRRVVCHASEIPLTPKEFDLLWFLAKAPGRVFTREKLLEHVWGYEYLGDARTVDTHVKNLREKLGVAGRQYIRTVWGVGYKFEVGGEAGPRRDR